MQTATKWKERASRDRKNREKIKEEQSKYLKGLEKQDFKKCSVCGKFVSNKEINDGLVLVSFTPDTYFTTEKIEYFHKNCKL